MKEGFYCYRDSIYYGLYDENDAPENGIVYPCQSCADAAKIIGKHSDMEVTMNRKTNRTKKYAALCAALLSMAVMAGCANSSADGKNSTGSATSSPATENAANGDTQTQQTDPAAFPAFTATALDGSTVTESIFSEKDLTVLNIWGTFCGPCIGEMPKLGEWAKEMPDNVQIVGLIIDINGEEDTEHRDLAVDITQQAGVDFTNLIANADFAPILKDVIGVPTTLFIDGDGNIVGDPIVGADVDGYISFVENYLSEQ